jgi:chemotaxis protein histidine kinase CheA
MIADVNAPAESVEIRPIGTDGALFALLEDDVIGVLPLDAGAQLERVDGALAMAMDDRLRPLLSLRDQVCRPRAGAAAVEAQVVIVRIGAELLGLLVEWAGTPTHAVARATAVTDAAPALFSHVALQGGGRDLPVLNPLRLARSVASLRPRAARRAA